MKILILGNGFDLAHKLPTKYSDFLNFCKHVQLIWTYRPEPGDWTKEFKKAHLDNWETDESIRQEIEENFHERHIHRRNNGDYELTFDNGNKVLPEVHASLIDNVWYSYFEKLYDNNLMKGENWIDFESEIREVIQTVDQESNSLLDPWEVVLCKISSNNFNKSPIDDKWSYFDESLDFSRYYTENGFSSDHEITVRDFRSKTYEDLERIIRALELYFAYFINIIPINREAIIPEIDAIHPNHILNFNYTNTYERRYKKKEDKGDVYYIHGKAETEHLPDDNNMVLGINEYWPENERDEHTNFTIFKKFAQRIQKHTGNENYKWMKDIQDQYEKKKLSQANCKDPLINYTDGISYVYVFGHSLDITDKDILSDLLGNEATAVTIYCRDKETEGELIANAIGLISEQRLLEKANFIPTKFDFKILQK